MSVFTVEVLSFVFETPATGTVLPSYAVESRVLRTDKLADMVFYLWTAVGFALFFMIFELIEMLSSSFLEYFTNVWNLMDWANYLLFSIAWHYLSLSDRLASRDRSEVCISPVCLDIGYYDGYELTSTTKSAKTVLSGCMCIQVCGRSSSSKPDSHLPRPPPRRVIMHSQLFWALCTPPDDCACAAHDMCTAAQDRQVHFAPRA